MKIGEMFRFSEGGKGLSSRDESGKVVLLDRSIKGAKHRDVFCVSSFIERETFFVIKGVPMIEYYWDTINPTTTTEHSFGGFWYLHNTPESSPHLRFSCEMDFVMMLHIESGNYFPYCFPEAMREALTLNGYSQECIDGNISSLEGENRYYHSNMSSYMDKTMNDEWKASWEEYKLKKKK
jgi:hypothetical protein